MKIFCKKNCGVSIAWILVLLPAVFWLFRLPIASRFTDSTAIFTSLGQLSGLLGMSMFLVVIILSGRFKFMESYFGGMNQIYFWHHFFGGLSLILLLFHPVILAVKFMKYSVHLAALFLLPIGQPAIAMGIFALLAMILLLVFTFFIKFPYQTWKITHKFLGVALFLAILHTFFVPSDVSQYLPLKIYFGIFALISLATYFYRTILGKFLVKKYRYQVDDVKKLNDQVIEIIMSPLKEKMNFLPGQYIFISFLSEGISPESHPFSISSGGTDLKLRIVVKALGKYTANLKNMKPGTLAKIEGPFGTFSYLNSKNKSQVWLAGGVGVTPFLSMARTLSDEYNIHLYYCVKTKSEFVFYDELEKTSATKNNFKLISYCADELGYINLEAIKQKSGDLTEKDFFLCGPPAMMQNIKSALLKSGIKKENIHSEEFNF